MRAVVIIDGRIVVEDRPDPEPGVGQVLVRVRSAGLNAADLLQMRGFYPAPPGVPADIPGLELAGVVEANGPGASRFAVGERVMAVVAGGGQAELAVVHERGADASADRGLDDLAAGGFPEAFTTAHDAVFTQAGLTVGERLLVHGGAGGVGTAAIQLGLAAGASVVATVRNVERRAEIEALGAAAVAPEGFTDHGPFDVILELIGASNLAGNLANLAVGGRITVIGVGGSGARGEIDLLTLMQKRGRIHGSTLRARPPEQKADAARRVERHVLPLIESGAVHVPVSATFPIADASSGYEAFAAGGKLGKLILTLA